jgi:hypothetical protein
MLYEFSSVKIINKLDMNVTDHIIQPVFPESFACKDIKLSTCCTFGKDCAIDGDVALQHPGVRL